MNSIAKATTRSKKTTRLGSVQVLRPEQYDGFDVETKVECIQELLEDEVRALAGIKYARKAASGLPGYRHGSHPGNVRLAGQRHPLKIPRVQSNT